MLILRKFPRDRGDVSMLMLILRNFLKSDGKPKEGGVIALRRPS